MKKLLAIFLALSMMVAMLAVPVFAGEGTIVSRQVPGLIVILQ